MWEVGFFIVYLLENEKMKFIGKKHKENSKLEISWFPDQDFVSELFVL